MFGDPKCWSNLAPSNGKIVCLIYFDQVEQSSVVTLSIGSILIHAIGRTHCWFEGPLSSSKCFLKKEQGWMTHQTWFFFFSSSLRFAGLVLAPSYAFVCCPGYKLFWHRTSLNTTLWRIFCEGFWYWRFWLNCSVVPLFFLFFKEDSCHVPVWLKLVHSTIVELLWDVRHVIRADSAKRNQKSLFFGHLNKL